MKVIGITGPIGCGKSYISSLIAKRGIPSIDSDLVYHSLICAPSETVTAIVSEFGREILDSNGGIDRKALSAAVISSPDRLKKLNEITHPRVIAELERLISEAENSGASAVLVQVPLMFESGFDKRCDSVICVVADEDVRVKRICERDGCLPEIAKKRINNQKDIQFYIANSSERVYNNGTDDPNEQIDRLLGELGIAVSAKCK